MSGFNWKTRTFQLTHTQASRWHRKPIDPNISAVPLTMQYYAEVRRRAGLQVTRVQDWFLEVKVQQPRIWEASAVSHQILSGPHTTDAPIFGIALQQRNSNV